MPQLSCTYQVNAKAPAGVRANVVMRLERLVAALFEDVHRDWGTLPFSRRKALHRKAGLLKFFICPPVALFYRLRRLCAVKVK